MSITRTITLPCDTERAFLLFTRRISEWWPPERRHTGDPTSVIVLSEEGRFYEQGKDGHVVELGAVLAWEAPRRLLLDWYPGTDVAHPTRVEIRFEAEGSFTRVTVEHNPTEASEALFPLRAPRYEASWKLVLDALERAALDNE